LIQIETAFAKKTAEPWCTLVILYRCNQYFFSSHPTPEPICHKNAFLAWAHICSWSVKLCSHHILIPNVAPIYRPLSWTS